MSEQLDTYEAYMGFGYPEEQDLEVDPWRAERIEHALMILGAAHPSVTTAEARAIRDCYDRPESRYFHKRDHGGFVGQGEVPDSLAHQLDGTPFTKERAEALLMIAGLFHDISYKQIDADEDGQGAWSAFVGQTLSGIATYERELKDDKWIYTTKLTEEGWADEVTRMVAHIFDVPADGIAHTQGGNEFDSALAAAKFLERKGVNPLDIVAVVTAIAATIPFTPSIAFDEQGNLTNGFVGELAGRVDTAQLHLGDARYRPDLQTTHAIMCMAVHLVNRDTSDFIWYDNAGGLAEGGYRLRLESVRSLRKDQITISGLMRVARLRESAGLYRSLRENPELVPKIYLFRSLQGLLGLDHAYPPKPAYDQAVQYVGQNVQGAILRSEIHELGIVFAGCVAARMRWLNAPVPGIVDEALWLDDLAPEGPLFDALSETDQRLYAEQNGVNQNRIGALMPARKPVSGFILGAAGLQGARLLSRNVQNIYREADAAGEKDPFSDYDRADVFIRQVRASIGEQNYRKLIQQFIRVALVYANDADRIALLEGLLA
jgi:hypothetical protein